MQAAPEMRVAIVTDSASDLPQSAYGTLGVHVVSVDCAAPPSSSSAGSTNGASPWRGGVKAAPRTAVDLLTGRFVETYEQLALDVDAILSIHVSSRLAAVVEAARAARAQLRGVIPIEIVDSGAAGVALAFIVRRVAEAARDGASLGDLALLARRAGGNVHAMFFAESLDQIAASPRFGRERAWPIHGNGTRPLLQVEDGEVRPLERVRTRARGYDRLAEFVELFPRLETLAIFHDANPAEVELLVRRITHVFPRERIIFGSYGPTLRSQLGNRAIGVFVDQGFESD